MAGKSRPEESLQQEAEVLRERVERLTTGKSSKLRLKRRVRGQELPGGPSDRGWTPD